MPCLWLIKPGRVGFHEAQAGYVIKSCCVVLVIIYLGSRMHVLQRHTGCSSAKWVNSDVQAELCGKLRFRKQSPELLGFSRLEAMSKKTPNKLIVWGKSCQWKFKNSAHLLNGCYGCPMKLSQAAQPPPLHTRWPSIVSVTGWIGSP